MKQERYARCSLKGVLEILKKHSPHYVYLTPAEAGFWAFRLHKGDAIDTVTKMLASSDAEKFHATVLQETRNGNFRCHSGASTCIQLELSSNKRFDLSAADPIEWRELQGEPQS